MTGTFQVRGVKSKLARNARTGQSYQVWDVYLAHGSGGVWTEIVSTTDALKASVCKRAGETGRLVTVGAKDSRFGLDLVTVELTDGQIYGAF